jgi:hypothetical protein
MGRRHGYRLRVISGGERNYPTLPATLATDAIKRHQKIRCAANLESSTALQVFALEVCRNPRRRIEQPGMSDGRSLRQFLNTPGGCLNIRERNVH